MIPPIDQARRYLSKFDPAISGNGGHNKTYHVACILVNGFGLSIDDARLVMSEYNQACLPPWSASEIDHKLVDAERTPEPKGKGHLLNRNGSVSYKFGSSIAPPIRRDEPVKAAVGKYEVDAFADIPGPIPDGTRELIKAAFAPGEAIRIAQARIDDNGKEVPKDSGSTLSREEWLRKLDAHGGDVNKFLRTSDRTGIFISVNPFRVGGSRDSDVTSYRHCLLEWDKHLSLEEQWSLITQSEIPCTAVILSGGKSVHAWVNIDAKDRTEFNERVALVYKHFEEWKPDPQNKNPSRLSRLPGCERGKKRQELIALNIGKKSFSEWHASLEVDGIGKVVSVLDLMKFDPENDVNSILGKRWICKGGSCLIVGQSGIGKSSFAIQAACTWALGRSFFGITPARPLKSLFIQSENDDGDLAEMLQGALGPSGLACSPDEIKTISENVIIVRDTVHTGFGFCQAVQRLIDRYKPDLVWFDPLMSFIGDDISKNLVCTQFFRTWMGPIAESTGVVWMVMHHTGKPPSDPKGKKQWTSSDYSYSGIGGSELTNIFRAVCNLDQFNDAAFLFRLSKRGKRAGATDFTGNPTTKIWLKHSDVGIRWEQIPEPEQKEKQAKQYSGPQKAGRPNKLDSLRPHIQGFVDSFGEEEVLSLKEASKRLIGFASVHDVDLSDNTADGIIKQIGQEGLMSVTPTQEGYRVCKF